MTQTFDDAPRVIVFPALGPDCNRRPGGRPLQWVDPFGLFNGLSPGLRIVSGVALLAVGIAFMAGGLRALVRSGTNVHPARPALALVDTDIFQWTRNPIYLGGSFIMFGCAFLFALDSSANSVISTFSISYACRVIWALFKPISRMPRFSASTTAVACVMRV